MQAHQIIIVLILAAALFLLGMLVFRRTGHARGRGWLIFVLAVILAIGIVTMLWPMFGFSA